MITEMKKRPGPEWAGRAIEKKKVKKSSYTEPR
jgi:hypothetical protein